jgi:hypothetical protein
MIFKSQGSKNSNVRGKEIGKHKVRSRSKKSGRKILWEKREKRKKKKEGGKNM